MLIINRIDFVFQHVSQRFVDPSFIYMHNIYNFAQSDGNILPLNSRMLMKLEKRIGAGKELTQAT